MNPDMLRKLPYWHPNCFASIKRLVHMLATVLHSGKKTKVYTEQKVSYLFDTYGDAVLRAAYAYLHNMDDAEDVLQNTFVQYLRAEPIFENSAHEKAWLLRVAINLSKNKLNSVWYKRTDALTEAYPCAQLDDELACVWDAVRSLPPKYREPIHLFYHEGYSTAEIAGILETKEATVRSLLHRGRGMLKDILQEAYDFDDEI
nr:sigma-70 family RNA polymerase sigma factor [uncultured Agathobaculum sp.]